MSPKALLTLPLAFNPVSALSLPRSTHAGLSADPSADARACTGPIIPPLKNPKPNFTAQPANGVSLRPAGSQPSMLWPSLQGCPVCLPATRVFTAACAAGNSPTRSRDRPGSLPSEPAPSHLIPKWTLSPAVTCPEAWQLLRKFCT